MSISFEVVLWAILILASLFRRVCNSLVWVRERPPTSPSVAKVSKTSVMCASTYTTRAAEDSVSSKKYGSEVDGVAPGA